MTPIKILYYFGTGGSGEVTVAANRIIHVVFPVAITDAIATKEKTSEVTITAALADRFLKILAISEP